MARAILTECSRLWLAPIRLLEILFLCSRGMTGTATVFMFKLIRSCLRVALINNKLAAVQQHRVALWDICHERSVSPDIIRCCEEIATDCHGATSEDLEHVQFTVSFRKTKVKNI